MIALAAFTHFLLCCLVLKLLNKMTVEIKFNDTISVISRLKSKLIHSQYALSRLIYIRTTNMKMMNSVRMKVMQALKMSMAHMMKTLMQLLKMKVGHTMKANVVQLLKMKVGHTMKANVPG